MANFVVSNSGVVDLTVDTVSFLFGSSGNSAAFSFGFGGADYVGALGSVSYPVAVFMPAGAQLPADLSFAPTEEQYDSILLELGYEGEMAQVEVAGLGGHEGDPFLHVVIDNPPYVVDYDGDGHERVSFDGTGSHTHEPGRSLAGFVWRENDAPISQRSGGQPAARHRPPTIWTS